MIGPGRALGDYLLGDVLGDGGMGRVFAAEHRARGVSVAIKVLHERLGHDARAVERFLAEATRTRSIAHPNVVRVLDFGRADDGTPYLVMERLHGEDGKALLKRRGRLPEAEVRRLGAAIAGGLQAAHALGIVHRDLKPANLLITDGGEPKILDFGIARQWTGAQDSTGSRIGTVEYMAPEQVTGGIVGPAIDVFALGVVLFELVTGELPFTGYRDGACPQLFQPPRAPHQLVELSPAFEALLLDCLRRSPAKRPSSMSEVRDRLLGADGDRHTAPLTDPPPHAPARPPRRSRAPSIAAISALLLAGAALTATLTHRPPVATPPAAAPVPVPAPTPAKVADPPPPTVELAAPPTVLPHESPPPHHRSPPATHKHLDLNRRSPVHGERLN